MFRSLQEAALAAADLGTVAAQSCRELREHLPAATLLTGVLPVQEDLSRQAEAAALQPFAFPDRAQSISREGRTTVWTDGGCLYPKDPLMARAAWGLRVDSVENCNWGGPVQGRQTAQRGEVAAAVAASLLIERDLEVVTDSMFLVKACARIKAGEAFDEWAHADLWGILAPHVRSGRITTRWVKAHLSASAAAERGMAERDRLGNAAADSNAGRAAISRLPSQAVVAGRLRTLQALEAVQRTIASVQLRVLQSRPRVQQEEPRQRCWRRVNRGARRRATSVPTAVSRRVGLRPTGARLAEASGVQTAGASLHAFFQGRAWRPHSIVQGPGIVVCLRCGDLSSRVPVLRASPCTGWRECFPPRAWGMLMFGGLHCCGGSATDFDSLLQQRLAQLPAAPD